MAATVALKKELRARIKKLLANLPDAAVEAQSAAAIKTLLATPEYQTAARISVYLSMPSGEIATDGIVRDALKNKKRVFIPYTYKLSAPAEGQPRSIMDMVELCSLDDYEGMQRDHWGIPTPGRDSLSSRANAFGGTGLTDGNPREASDADSGLDLIVMPGMAFDADLGRLGHGKGFYDHFLQRCHQSSRMPFRVGLSLTEQFLPPGQSVPMDSTDYRLDSLILGSGEVRRTGA